MNPESTSQTPILDLTHEAERGSQAEIDLHSSVEVVPVDPRFQPPAVVRTIIEAQQLEYTTFLDAGYVDGPEDLAEELAPYQEASQFYIARDGSTMAGVARIINYSDAGFKTLHDIAAGRLDSSNPLPTNFSPSDTFEIATLSISEEYRHSTTGMLIYGAMVAKSVQEESQSILASFDDGPEQSFLREFEAFFPTCITRLGEPVDYMGTPTTPVCISVDDALAHIDSDPDVAKLLRSVTLRVAHDGKAQPALL